MAFLSSGTLLILINQYDMYLVLVFFFFPDERNVWWNDVFESTANQELSFAGPSWYPAAVGCQGQVSKNAVKCVSEELLNSDLQMLYPYFACDLELLISNKNIW